MRKDSRREAAMRDRKEELFPGARLRLEGDCPRKEEIVFRVNVLLHIALECAERFK